MRLILRKCLRMYKKGFFVEKDRMDCEGDIMYIAM